MFLVVIAIKADDAVLEGGEWIAVVAIAASLLPAPGTVAALWISARPQIKTLKSEAISIEQRVLESAG